MRSIFHTCRECRVVKVSDSEHEDCPLCLGRMTVGTPPRGTYAPLTEAARHEAFERMASGNSDFRG